MMAGHTGFSMVFFVIAVVGAVVTASFALSTWPVLAAPVSETIKHSSEADFLGAQLEGVVWQNHGAAPGGGTGGESGGQGLALEKTPGGCAPSGTVTSKPLPAAFPFNNVVLSWNILAPEGTGAVIEVRAGSDPAHWTGWYEIARWGKLRSRVAPGLKKDEMGLVNEDSLELRSKASLLQYRITLLSEDHDATPMLKLVAACYAETDSEAAVPAFAPPRDPSQAPWVRDLPVPFRSQRSEDPSIAGRICSPTCVAMALEYHGAAVPTATVAAQAYDSLNSIYGNWPFNTAAVALYGLEGYVTRFPGFEPVQDEIAAGRPVIISIRFGRGQLKGGPLNSTSGHLIVVRGFTKDGDVIANDPAGRTEAEGHVVYRRDELLRAWKNGIAYIIRPVKP